MQGKAKCQVMKLLWMMIHLASLLRPQGPLHQNLPHYQHQDRSTITFGQTYRDNFYPEKNGYIIYKCIACMGQTLIFLGESRKNNVKSMYFSFISHDCVLGEDFHILLVQKGYIKNNVYFGSSLFIFGRQQRRNLL